MKPTELKKKIESNEDIVILDVRTDQEREFTKITPSLHIPVNEIGIRISEIPKDKSVVCYCHSGGRSAYAVSFLKQHGFKAENLEGGTVAYSKVDKKVKIY
jgi:rhodanese-related sulfurtransferase